MLQDASRQSPPLCEPPPGLGLRQSPAALEERHPPVKAGRFGSPNFAPQASLQKRQPPSRRSGALARREGGRTGAVQDAGAFLQRPRKKLRQGGCGNLLKFFHIRALWFCLPMPCNRICATRTANRNSLRVFQVLPPWQGDFRHNPALHSVYSLDSLCCRHVHLTRARAHRRLHGQRRC